MTIDVFNPAGKTVPITAVSTPTTATKVTVGLQTPQFRIVHPGTELVWIGVGNDEATALAAATGDSGLGVPLLPGTDEIFTFDTRTFFAARCEKSTQVIYVTPGYGM